MVTHFRLDPSWRRPGNGRVVVAGSPLRLFRLSPGGAHVVSLVEEGVPPTTDAVRQLLDRFVDAGALHPLPSDSPFSGADVTIVMPVFGTLPPRLPAGPTIVVDDGNAPPLVAPPDAPHVQLVRLDHNAGPAAARNAGLAHVTTPLVAFLDADVEWSDDGLTRLLVHFTDPKVALVAPRVASSPGTSWLDGYEVRHSPLDLGPDPARVVAGTRVSYVPAALVVCRVDAVRAVGGFDESLRLGEDVDLGWRLAQAGQRCRYEPTVVVHHRPRPSLIALLRQRFGYGTSAAPLAVRHPGALAPARMSGWSLVVWALVAARRPFAALVVAAGTGVALQRKLRDVPAAESARLVGLGHIAAGRQLAYATRRVWWPVAVVGLCLRRTRALVVAALLLPPAVEAVRGRTAQPLIDAPMRVLDDAAYGAGVWFGVLREREVGPLRPELTSWPRRAGG
jgi:mycofactocin system glycosyltransferase